MDPAGQPDLNDIEERFVALLEGRLSRDEVDRWAMRWVAADDLRWGELEWWALDLLAGVDLRHGPTADYLHGDDQLRAWLREFRQRRARAGGLSGVPALGPNRRSL